MSSEDAPRRAHSRTPTVCSPGFIQELTSCGGTGTRIVSIVANPADNSITVLLVLQLTGAADDAAIYDGVLSSFNLIGPAAAGGATTTVA